VGRDCRPARAGRARLRPAIVAATLLLAAACDGGASGDRLSPTPPAPDATPAATFAPAGDAGAVVEQLVQACREKDAPVARGFVAAPVPDAEIEALFARGDDVRLVSRTPAEIEDGRATVEVRLEIRRGGELDTVARVWQLARGDGGVWRFTELPDCY